MAFLKESRDYILGIFFFTFAIYIPSLLVYNDHDHGYNFANW